MKLAEISKNTIHIPDKLAVLCNLCFNEIPLSPILQTRDELEKYMQKHKCFKENANNKTEKSS